MNYYSNLITEKSWQELGSLKRLVDFVLIGGWAVYLYTQALKSKDIDILIGYGQLEKLKQRYVVFKNGRLKKYEARRGEIQIDVYLPYYSQIGIPVEDLISHTVVLSGFTTLEVEYLLTTKVYVLSRRQNTPKGRKDLADILALWRYAKVDPALFKAIIRQYSLGKEWYSCQKQVYVLSDFPELKLNHYTFARFKKYLQQVVD